MNPPDILNNRDSGGLTNLHVRILSWVFYLAFSERQTRPRRRKGSKLDINIFIRKLMRELSGIEPTQTTESSLGLRHHQMIDFSEGFPPARFHLETFGFGET